MLLLPDKNPNVKQNDNFAVDNFYPIKEAYKNGRFRNCFNRF